MIDQAATADWSASVLACIPQGPKLEIGKALQSRWGTTEPALTVGLLTLQWIQNDDFSPRLVAQIINELVDLFGNLLFGKYSFDAVARLLQRRN